MSVCTNRHNYQEAYLKQSLKLKYLSIDLRLIGFRIIKCLFSITNYTSEHRTNANTRSMARNRSRIYTGVPIHAKFYSRILFFIGKIQNPEMVRIGLRNDCGL